MKKLGIGVMGGANIAKRLVIPAILKLPEAFELKAIASRTPEKAVELAAQFLTDPITGYANLLDRDDIDVIYMPLPTGLHAEWIEKALHAGKHVFAEKSLAADHHTAKSLVDLARSKGLLLMENFMFRYHSQHQKIWEMLQSGFIGDVRLFRSQFGFPPLDRNNFRYDKATGGGALLDAGAYTVRASQWFLGPELEVMSAALYMDPEKEVDVYGNATLVNKKGVVSQVAFGFDNYYQCNYEFWGSKGRIFAERAFTPKPDERPGVVIEKPGDTNRVEMDPDNHFINILLELHQSVVSNHHEQHLVDILEQSRLLQQIKSSAIHIRL